jgi:diphthine synthase
MLYLIGLGLNDERDITLKAVDVARKCECFIETYTNVWKGSLENLAKILGKEVKQLKRKDLEDDIDSFLERARNADVALFIPGDPLAATTHMDIAYEARKRKIIVKIIHNASIFSAVGEVGLQLYKFGKTATIPMNARLESVIETLKMNKKAGLHTMLLLDIDREKNVNLKVSEAVSMLINKKLAKETDMLAVLSNAGDNSKVYYDSARNLRNMNIDVPAVIVVPGKMHFREKDFLEALKW